PSGARLDLSASAWVSVNRPSASILSIRSIRSAYIGCLHAEQSAYDAGPLVGSVQLLDHPRAFASGDLARFDRVQDLVDPALVLSAQRLELGDEIVDALAHGRIADIERLRERLQVAAGQNQRLGEEQILGGQAQQPREPEFPGHMHIAVGARHLAYGEQSVADR